MPAGESPHPLLVELGARIAARRTKLGISQEALAERARVHRTYLVGIESGRRNVTVVVLIALAEALGIAPDRLVHGLELDGARPTRPRTGRSVPQPPRRAKGTA